MTYRSIILAGSAAALMALTGCASNPSNQQIGTGAGAVLGGTAGAVGGAAAGALIGNEVGKRSDDNRDHRYYDNRYNNGYRYDNNGRRY